MKKLSLTISLIAFAVAISGCKTFKVAPPPIVKECAIVAVDGGIPYLYCKMSDGSNQHRIKISDLPKRPEKYVCTDDKSYTAMWAYGEALGRWIEKNCR